MGAGPAEQGINQLHIWGELSLPAVGPAAERECRPEAAVEGADPAPTGGSGRHGVPCRPCYPGRPGVPCQPRYPGRPGVPCRRGSLAAVRRAIPLSAGMTELWRPFHPLPSWCLLRTCGVKRSWLLRFSHTSTCQAMEENSAAVHAAALLRGGEKDPLPQL